MRDAIGLLVIIAFFSLLFFALKWGWDNNKKDESKDHIHL